MTARASRRPARTSREIARASSKCELLARAIDQYTVCQISVRFFLKKRKFQFRVQSSSKMSCLCLHEIKQQKYRKSSSSQNCRTVYTARTCCSCEQQLVRAARTSCAHEQVVCSHELLARAVICSHELLARAGYLLARAARTSRKRRFCPTFSLGICTTVGPGSSSTVCTAI